MSGLIAAGSLAGLLASGAGMFVAGGIVKGTLGVGLPLVVVPLLSLIVPPGQAMGLLVLPVLLSNVLQALQGGRVGHAIRRFGPLMVAQLLATLLTVRLSRDLSQQALSAGIAISVISAVALMALQPKAEVDPRHERWAGPLVGALGGTMAGFSSLQGPVLITYMMALRLKRDEFVGSISIVYLLGSIPLYAAMLAWGRFSWVDVGWSALALLPMYIGLRIGTAVRGRLSETVFRRVLLAFLVLLSVLLLLK